MGLNADALSTLPPLPDPPPGGLLVLFSPRQWDWMTKALQSIREGQNATFTALGPLTSTLEGVLMATDDLSSAVGRAESATAASLAAQSMEIQQLRDAVAALGSAPTQAELDAFRDRVNGIADRLEAGTSSLGADDPAPTP